MSTQHETCWIEYHGFYSSPIVIHTLGDRRVLGWYDGEKVVWEPATRRGLSWWAGWRELGSEEDAIKWLYSNESPHRKMDPYDSA